jgi:hypothetical protein
LITYYFYLHPYRVSANPFFEDSSKSFRGRNKTIIQDFEAEGWKVIRLFSMEFFAKPLLVAKGVIEVVHEEAK